MHVLNNKRGVVVDPVLPGDSVALVASPIDCVLRLGGPQRRTASVVQHQVSIGLHYQFPPVGVA